MAGKGWRKLETRVKDIENGEELVESAEKGDAEAVKRLLEGGVSVNAEEYNRSRFYKSQNYLTPLQCAAKYGHADIVRLLVQYEAELNAVDRFDVTAVHLAAENGHLDCLQLLLDAGADCDVATKYSKYGSYTAVPHVGGTHALHLSAKNNHVDCAKELILNGADYNAVDEMGRTSLYIAGELGYEEMVLIHLTNAVGRDILSLPVKNTKETPLHECVRKGIRSCVRELLQHGSDVNEKNAAGSSALHLAVHNTEKFSIEMVQDLVKHGYNTDVNLCDGAGYTPLHYVCFNDNSLQNRRPHVAAFLIAHGADFLSLKNKQGLVLLAKELLISPQPADKIILQAMVKTMSTLPPLTVPTMRRLNPNQVPEQDKYRWYNDIRVSVRSLQHYCRVVVRNSLGAIRLRHIPDLPVPDTLQDYLMLEYDEYR